MSDDAHRIVVLDRDGVINYDSDEYIKSPSEWHPIPGSLQAIADFCAAGYEVFVVTNQSGLARGLFTLATLEAINERMRVAVETHGGSLAGIYYCPHAPNDGCECRKPKPGLLRQIESEHGLSLSGQVFVGDKCSDVQAAMAVNARPIIVRTGHGERTLADCPAPAPAAFDNLAAVAEAILRSEEQ